MKTTTTLPPWFTFIGTADALARAPGEFAWSNPLPPPPIGAVVTVRVNGMGPARVLGYFVQDGFLGLYVAPLSPPAWYIRQNGPAANCHVFGAELI